VIARTDGRSLLRNATFNVVGLAVPLLLAVVTIPPLIRGFGSERFGILTLAWAAIGYFNLFELGLSRALTQAVAQRLGHDDLERDEIAGVVWTTQALLLGLGALAAIVLVATTPLIVGRALTVSESLRGEATTCFKVIALALPLALMSAGMRGLMEAHQDFGLVNAIRLPVAAFTFLGPLSVLPFTHSLVPAIVVLVIGRALGWLAHGIICLKRYAYLRAGVIVRRAVVGPLVRYGGWTTVSNVVSPLMVYMDRFVIAAVLSVAAVTNYVTPYEVVSKLMIVPGSLLNAVFPAFAASFATAPRRSARLYDRSQRIVLLVVFPMALPTIALAHEGLRLWIGGMLPPESAVALQWLALGVFVNALAQAPHTALQGAGRPDLVARLHVMELPIYAVAMWWLLHRFGIVGVAIAWTLRVTLDTLALLFIAHRRLNLRLETGSRVRVRAAILMLAALALAAVPATTSVRILYVCVVTPLFVWLTWRHLLTDNERIALLHWPRTPRRMRTELV